MSGITLDIFNNDAFGLVSMTDAINNTPYVPGQINQRKLFTEKGISTTAMQLDIKGTTVSLVPSAPRGASGKSYAADKARTVPISTIHLPQRGGVNADQIQGVRAFGTMNEVQTVQGIVNEVLAKMRRDMDATIEFQSINAIKGKLYDSDGTTLLLDLYDLLGVTQQTKSLVLGTPTTNVRNKVTEALRLQDAALGNLVSTGNRAYCSASFFDALTGHAKVEGAFDRFQNGSFLRDDLRQGFYFAGVYWEEYRGKIGGIDFIADGEAYLVPEGVAGLFVRNFAPADYIETVNTIGLPYYARQELRDMNKGIDIEAQSNPISVNTLPASVIKLTV